MPSPTPNFIFPLPSAGLSNSAVTLLPFDKSIHATLFADGVRTHPGLFTYLPYGPIESAEAFLRVYEGRLEPDPAIVLFAVVVRDEGGTGNGGGVRDGDAENDGEEGKGFAGLIGLLNASEENLCCEVGFITILPQYHHTHVASNAIGLLLLHLLDPPTSSPPSSPSHPNGVGLRRIVWQTHTQNEASRRVALKMGFTFEGVARFQRILPAGKLGNGWEGGDLGMENADVKGPSRDTAIFAHYCDEWVEKREAVLKVMGRR